MLISLIAAMTPERVIGLNGKLPWNVPEDLKHFKTLTTDRTVLMGRKTFDSIHKPLPNRTNLILTRRIPPDPPAGTLWFAKLEDAIATAKNSGESELFIVGGAKIYALAMPLADRMYISIIKLHEPVAGDTWFPHWDPAQWAVEHREERPNVEFLTYRRVGTVKQ